MDRTEHYAVNMASGHLTIAVAAAEAALRRLDKAAATGDWDEEVLSVVREDMCSALSDLAAVRAILSSPALLREGFR